ncbi:MAG: glycoside-pentoside-hexuronide (GPH):cation symporter [Oscillospiraceae bacterium]|nr:glycoside-pentoside-hexuronide (GPH):cation symporter [Oscillospiraceae bacterium]
MGQKLLTYTKKEQWLFLVAIVGQNVFYGIFSSAFDYFMRFTLLIPSMAVGTAMLLARAFDAFNDPVMGVIVDRTNTKWGKCRPYLFAIPTFLLLTTVMSFMSPFGTYTRSQWPALVAAWAFAAYVLFSVAYTVSDIPLWGITSLTTEDHNDRNRLLANARVVAAAGMALGFIVMPIAETLGLRLGSDQRGFLVTAILFAVIGFAMMQPVPFGMKERINPKREKTGLFHAFKVMWSNRPFRRIVISGVLASPKMLISLVALPLMTYYFSDDKEHPIRGVLLMGLVLAGMFGGQFIAQALLPKLLARFSKKKLFIYSNLFAVGPSLLAFLLYRLSPMNLIHPVNITLLAICFTFVGIGIGVPVVLMSIMIADCVDYQEYQTGERPDGIFFSGQSFVAKLQTALASFIMGIGYNYVGFSDVAVEKVKDYIAQGGVARANPDFQPYMMIMFFLITIPAAIGFILTILPMWKYELDTEEHDRIMAELNERRHGVEAEQVQE